MIGPFTDRVTVSPRWTLGKGQLASNFQTPDVLKTASGSTVHRLSTIRDEGLSILVFIHRNVGIDPILHLVPERVHQRLDPVVRVSSHIDKAIAEPVHELARIAP